VRSTWLLVMPVMAACYHTTHEQACQVSCVYNPAPELNGPCPGELQCFADRDGGGICMTAQGTCGQMDASADPRPDAPPNCFGTLSGGLYPICLDAMPSDAFQWGDRTIDTSPSNLECLTETHPPSVDACLIAGSEIQINGIVRVSGPRPLVLLSSTTITVSGTLDAASHVSGPSSGPGIPAACAPVAEATGSLCGGAGGSFQGAGGNGGIASGCAGGREGQPAAPISPVTAIRGGCPGGQGDPNSGTARAVPGAGGGAVYLLAGTSITVVDTGLINASGAGAMAGAGINGPGSGGGSGGLIGLDAPAITVLGSLMASGGGGSSGFDGATATSGSDPVSLTSGGGLGGMTSTTEGGQGAPALPGFLIEGGTPMTVSAINAAGGGGGAGYIVVYPTSLGDNIPNANVFPPIVVQP
jgi:hypothetical protein